MDTMPVSETITCNPVKWEALHRVASMGGPDIAPYVAEPAQVGQAKVCQECSRLSHSVIKASERISLRQAEQARVRGQKDISTDGKPLAEAMRMASLAIAALDKHRAEHGY